MAKWSQDTKLGELLNDPAAKAVLEEFVPRISTHPQIKLAHGMSLKTVAGFPQTGISKEKLAEINIKLQALR